jgi:hypothetical protein
MRSERTKAAAERARKRHLTELARDVEGAWNELTRLVAGSQYDQAVTLAIDLRDLAAREGEQAAFAIRFAARRKSQARRRSFFNRWRAVEQR